MLRSLAVHSKVWRFRARPTLPRASIESGATATKLIGTSKGSSSASPGAARPLRVGADAGHTRRFRLCRPTREVVASTEVFGLGRVPLQRATDGGLPRASQRLPVTSHRHVDLRQRAVPAQRLKCGPRSSPVLRCRCPCPGRLRVGGQRGGDATEPLVLGPYLLPATRVAALEFATRRLPGTPESTSPGARSTRRWARSSHFLRELGGPQTTRGGVAHTHAPLVRNSPSVATSITSLDAELS